MMNPIFPDAQPWDTMFKRGNGVTSVLMQESKEMLSG